MCNAITVYLITVWVRNNRVETFQNPRLPFFRKKNSLEHAPMLSEGFQNPKIGFQNPKMSFFRKEKKTALSTARFYRKIARYRLFPRSNQISVCTITVCNAITVCPKPCGHPIFDIEYCNRSSERRSVRIVATVAAQCQRAHGQRMCSLPHEQSDTHRLDSKQLTC